MVTLRMPCCSYANVGILNLSGRYLEIYLSFTLDTLIVIHSRVMIDHGVWLRIINLMVKVPLSQTDQLVKSVVSPEDQEDDSQND